MRKVAPTLQQGDAKSEQTKKRDNARTRVLLWLSLVDMGFLVFPYGWQLYPTLFYVGNDLLTTPITYFFSILVAMRSGMNFLVYWCLIPSFRETIKKFLVSGSA